MNLVFLGQISLSSGRITKFKIFLTEYLKCQKISEQLQHMFLQQIGGSGALISRRHFKVIDERRIEHVDVYLSGKKQREVSSTSEEERMSCLESLLEISPASAKPERSNPFIK